MSAPVYYPDYLQLDKILTAQQRESEKQGKPAHDEMLFIVIHQAYELWFKQILFEVDSAIDIFDKGKINDNSNDMQVVVHRLGRVVQILKVLVHQIDVLETMTAMDFLEFRNMLRPASGFQSIQFKILEAKLGLKFEDRHGQDYYLSQLKPEHAQQIKDIEAETNMSAQVNDWLERMPFFHDKKYWSNLASESSMPGVPAFWQHYYKLYVASLDEREKPNAQYFEDVLITGEKKLHFSPGALRAALFIMLYRGSPMLHLPFMLLSTLLDVDEQLATWRFRHINMVHRMIGSRIGTGGSTGKSYLQDALNKHYIFKDLAALTSFMINGHDVPPLPPALVQDLAFSSTGG